MVEQINHHSSGFPYRDIGGGLHAATLPRKIHHGGPIEPMGHPVHHDDGYVDALRRNAYNNQGVGESTSYLCPDLQIQGRMKKGGRHFFTCNFSIVSLGEILCNFCNSVSSAQIDLLRDMIDLPVFKEFSVIITSQIYRK